MSEEDRLQALNSLLLHCRKSKFYGSRIPERVLTSLEQIKELPFTSKEDIRNNSPYGLVCVQNSELYQYHETFGTTGTPASSWFTKEDFKDLARRVNESSVGFTQEDVVLVRFPYAISSVSHFVHLAAQEKGACVIPASSRSTVSPFTRIIDLMRKLHVTVLAGLPLQAILIAETAEIMGLSPRKDFSALRAIFTGGELLTPRKRKVIEKIWGVPVIDNYGMTETGVIAVDCSMGSLHAFDEDFILEILDDHYMDEVPPGEIGNLVITTLSRKAMPLVRYVTGDRVRQLKGICPCGRKGAIEVRGRIQDNIKIQDRVFDLWDLEEMLSCLNFGRFWIAGPSTDGILFLVEQESAADRVEVCQLESLERRYGVPIWIEMVPKGALYDRSELLSIGVVGKPRYIYTMEELKNKTYLKMDKN